MFLTAIMGLVSAVLVVGALVEVVARRSESSDAGGVRSESESTVRRLGRLGAERPWFVVVAIAVSLSFLAYPLFDAVLRAADVAAPFGYWDWSAYTGALDRWFRGEPMYVPNEDGGYFGGYLYPPVFLVVVWPFSHLDYRTGVVAWQLCSVVFLWLGLQLVIGELDYELRFWERGLLLWGLVGFHPLLFSVKQGQVSAFMAGLITVAGYELLRQRGDDDVAGYASGALTSVVGIVKLAYASVGAHLLTDRDRFLGAVGGGVAILAFSLAVFGVEPHFSYVDVLLWGKGNSGRSPLLWMPAYYQPLYGLAAVSLPLRILASLAIAVLAVTAAPNDVDRETFALGVAAIPLIAPRAYSYYLTALLPAALLLLAVEFERDGRPVVPVVVVFLLHVHAYGLKVAADYLPDVVPYGDAVVPAINVTVASLVVSLVQPGLWGALLLVGLAGKRVGAATTRPTWLDRSLRVER